MLSDNSVMYRGDLTTTNNQTKKLLLKVAKEEFMEKGFAKASLRSICKKAGVTTGALYFFFKDKEDLFGGLVREPLNKLILIAQRHFDEEESEIDHIIESGGEYRHETGVVPEYIDVLYSNFDAIYLVLERSQGSTYVNFDEKFIELAENHYRTLCNTYADAKKVRRISDEMIHWVAHVHINAFIYLIEHKIPRDQVNEQLECMVKYLMDGWMGMFETNKKF